MSDVNNDSNFGLLVSLFVLDKSLIPWNKCVRAWVRAHTHTHTYIYIYVCVCVCVYACVYAYVTDIHTLICWCDEFSPKNVVVASKISQ